MYVKFHSPFFRNGVLEYEANKPLDVPEALARTEIAKGFAVAVSAPKSEEPSAEKGKKGKKADE